MREALVLLLCGFCFFCSAQGGSPGGGTGFDGLVKDLKWRVINADAPAELDALRKEMESPAVKEKFRGDPMVWKEIMDITAWREKTWAWEVESLREAAGRGDADAQFRLGTAYEKGRGVPKDESKAAEWYKKAAGQGHEDARRNLEKMKGPGRGAAALPRIQKDSRALIKGWTRIEFSGLGSMDIPPTLEVQGKKLRDLNRSLSDIFKLDHASSETLIIQQAGYNNFKPGIPCKYARIMLENTKGKKGDFALPPGSFTKEDMDLLDKEIHASFNSSNTRNVGFGMKIIKWFPVEIVKIGGLPAIKISYIRQMSSNPYVYVEIFRIMNNDMLHELCMSYRMTEEAFWKDDFRKIKESVFFHAR